MYRNSIGNILHQSSSKKKNNVLCGPTHERIESQLSKTNNTFFAYNRKGVFKPGWNTNFAPIPSNYHLLNEQLSDDQLPFWLDFDIVLSQNKFGQFQILSEIANIQNIPLVSYEHTCAMSWWSNEQLKQLREMRGIMNVFISNYSLESWGWEDRGDTKVIYHGVDTDLFKSEQIQRGNYILTVGNDYIGRDSVLNFSQFKRVIIDNNLPYRARGDTKGFSTAPQNVNELVKEYQSARIFINTHHVSPIPTSLLEAAACGCGIVSCNTCGIPEIFTHKHDCLLYNNDQEMLEYLTMLLNDEAMAIELGTNARNTIREKCNPDRFVKEWNEVFDYVTSIG